MCGRYTLIKLSEFLNYFPWIEMTNAITAARYNIAPSQEVAAITNLNKPRVELLRWGLVPTWAKDGSITAGSKMINARSETLATKPSFSRLLKKQRCLVPASGFYEWQKNADGKTKTPFYFQLKNHRPFAFAGLWDQWRSPEGRLLRTVTIITTHANPLLACMHERMPVILKNQDCQRWIEPAQMTPAAAEEMLQPYPAHEMIAHPVSTSVNSPRHDSPDQINPVETDKSKEPEQFSLFPNSL